MVKCIGWWRVHERVRGMCNPLGQGNPLWGSWLLVGGPRVDSAGLRPASLTRGYRNAALFGAGSRQHRSEVKGQRSEFRGRKTESRSQRSEVRGQRSTGRLLRGWLGVSAALFFWGEVRLFRQNALSLLDGYGSCRLCSMDMDCVGFV